MPDAVTPIHSVKPQKREPGDLAAISTYYGRSVYDGAGERLGEVIDLVLGSDSRIGTAVIFTTKYFGFVKKTFEVPFSSLQVRTHKAHCYLVVQS
jgi:sporulation protein YlmC with PRC-barrel domain